MVTLVDWQDGQWIVIPLILRPHEGQLGTVRGIAEPHEGQTAGPAPAPGGGAASAFCVLDLSGRTKEKVLPQAGQTTFFSCPEANGSYRIFPRQPQAGQEITITSDGP
jgi:hypothetical protein